VKYRRHCSNRRLSGHCRMIASGLRRRRSNAYRRCPGPSSMSRRRQWSCRADEGGTLQGGGNATSCTPSLRRRPTKTDVEASERHPAVRKTRELRHWLTMSRRLEGVDMTAAREDVAVTRSTRACRRILRHRLLPRASGTPVDCRSQPAAAPAGASSSADNLPT